MEIRFRKKGFMFTLVAIFLISIFVFVLYASTSRVFVAKETLDAERTEAVIMNMYVDGFTDRYMDTFVHVAGRNALEAMVAYVEAGNTGDGLEDAEEFFTHVFAYGTVEASYDVLSLGTYDWDMGLIARNGTDSIVVETTSGGGTGASFGGTVAYAQPITGEENNPLDSIAMVFLTLENVSGHAESDDIFVLVYDADDYTFRAVDHKTFKDDDSDYYETMNFTFGAELPLDVDHTYYLVLAAPYVNDGDYSVAVTSSGDMEEWGILGDDSGTAMDVPIDFYLDDAQIKQGSMLGLVNNFAAFGTFHMNIHTDMTMLSFNVTQKDPWTIRTNATVQFTSNKISVTFTDVQAYGEANINITGLYDPYNLLMDWEIGIPVVPQTIGDDFDIEDFYEHVSLQTFVFNENAPSFLNRFEGENAESSSCCGIQTILNYDDLSTAYPADEDRGYSYIDHKFLGDECNVDDSEYVYHITSDPALPESWDSSLYGSSGPWYGYADVEFYSLDEMEDDGDLTLTADCPVSSS